MYALGLRALWLVVPRVGEWSAVSQLVGDGKPTVTCNGALRFQRLEVQRAHFLRPGLQRGECCVVMTCPAKPAYRYDNQLRADQTGIVNDEAHQRPFAHYQAKHAYGQQCWFAAGSGRPRGGILLTG